MVVLFVDLLLVIVNMVEIVKCCNLKFEFGKLKLLLFLMLDGMLFDDYLV